MYESIIFGQQPCPLDPIHDCEVRTCEGCESGKGEEPNGFCESCRWMRSPGYYDPPECHHQGGTCLAFERMVQAYYNNKK